MFRDIKSRKADETDFANSLKFLCDSLFTYYGVRPIILIDEYDAPIQKGYEKGYYDDVIGFMKSLFSAAFSGDDAVVTFAVMTGTMSVPREDITSDPDGLVACAVRCDRNSRCFGFTGEDVKKITDDFGHPEKMDEIRAWYGGYRFGNTEIFNPWSVLQHVEENFTTDTYWHGSSEHAILKRLIEKATRGDVKTLRGLIEDVPITDDIAKDVFFGDLFRRKTAERTLYTASMLATGFLAPKNDDFGQHEFIIHKEEIKRIYSEVILCRL